MPFIPHTEEEIRSMLETIGVSDIEQLFDEIPQSLRAGPLNNLPDPVSEMEIAQIMAKRAAQDGQPTCFVGAGAYHHHIPAAVWELTTRGEFYTAYTPYQAEASQGTLQLLYEYQSMMCALTSMDVSNASLYDGASALAEAVLMAVRANRKCKTKRILMPATVHPHYRRTVHTLVRNQNIELEPLDYNRNTGIIDPDSLPDDPGEFAALVIPQPGFLGTLEEVDRLTDWAHQHKALVIAVVNPISLGLLQPPGQWGEQGADICCGEGQPLGVPMSSGGPFYGFLTSKQAHVRQMPGRIIGKTVDLDGKVGFTLTLQAREQHIRRSKATSNICTNQGLVVTASTIHTALLGWEGLQRVAYACHDNTRQLVTRLTSLEGVDTVFERPYFHEVVIKLSEGLEVERVLRSMQAQNILAGYPLTTEYPELENCFLVCATETRSQDDIDQYVQHMERIISKQKQAKCPVQPKM